MKATGEVMAISDSFEAAFMKALRSLELNTYTLKQNRYVEWSIDDIRRKLNDIDDERVLVIAEALRRNIDIAKSMT